MKNIFIVFVLLAGLFLIPGVLGAASLQATLSKYEPFPVSPGQTVRVWLLIQNTASDDAKDVAVTLVPQYPFSLYSDSPEKNISQLGGNRDYLMDYTLKVDNNAVEGVNSFKVQITDASNPGSQKEFTIELLVQSKQSTLSIDTVKVDPAEISPGSDGTITLTVKNTAQNVVTDLSLKLFLQAVVGGNIIDLPFAPTESGTEKRLARLNPGESTDFVFNLKAYPDATSKVYKIPFALTWYDIQGNQNNKTDFVGVTVNSIPEVEVYIDKTDINSKKKSGVITLKIVNKGLSDLKFVNLAVNSSADYDLLSNSNTYYVGNLVSDDYQSVDYTINVKSAKDTIYVPVTLTYRDANNKYYVMTNNVPLYILDSAKLGQAASTGGSALVTIIIIIVIVAGIWFYVRSRNKKKKPSN